MLAEMMRPMELLAEAIGRRLGREVDDDVRMYAGATIGALALLEPHYEDVRTQIRTLSSPTSSSAPSGWTGS